MAGLHFQSAGPGSQLGGANHTESGWMRFEPGAIKGHDLFAFCFSEWPPLGKMRGTMKALLFGLCIVLLAITGTAQGTNALAGMAAKYDVMLNLIDRTGDRDASAARAELKFLLDSMEKSYIEHGDLDGVLSVRKAKEYTVSPDVQIPDEAIPASGRLSDILKNYIQKKRQAEQTCLNSRVALTRTYLSALDRMKEGFTKQSKAEEAMTVSLEIKRVTQAEPDLVAMARSESTATLAIPRRPAGPIPGRPWTSPTGIEFVYIRPGPFMMGSPSSEQDHQKDEMLHRVTLTKGYWLGKYEVTQAQWAAIMGSNPSRYKESTRPVERVSWNDCQEFIRKLSEKEGVPQGVYRLPTEAEWEYACRAGTTGPYTGNLNEIGWYNSNCGGTTHPVGTKNPNAWGLYDMHGNVWEWCQDWHGDYSSDNVTDPGGPISGSGRASRGGCYCCRAGNCRSATRYAIAPGKSWGYLGFRLLMTE